MRSNPKSHWFKEMKRRTGTNRKSGKFLDALTSRINPDSLIDYIDFPLKKFGDRK